MPFHHRMFSLIRKTDSRFICWKIGATGAEQTTIWSAVGASGQITIREGEGIPSEEIIELKAEEKKQDGFLDTRSLPILVIEFATVGYGRPGTFEKLGRLEVLMTEALGSAWVGICDQSSTGGDTAEVYCYVFDYEEAERIAIAAISETEFADYTRIYRQKRNTRDP